MNSWIFLVLFLGAGVAVNLFARFVWPMIRVRRVGDRERWALENGYNFDAGDRSGCLDAIGRPGLFAHKEGRAIRMLKGSRATLVDYTYLAHVGGRPSDSHTQRRLVTVAVCEFGWEAPTARIAPRTASVKLSEVVAFASLQTGDTEFDRLFHVDSSEIAGLTGRLAGAKARDALSQALAIDPKAVRRLLTPPVLAAMKSHPHTTFEFHGHHLLAYRQWRLLPNQRLDELVRAATDVQSALPPS